MKVRRKVALFGALLLAGCGRSPESTTGPTVLSSTSAAEAEDSVSIGSVLELHPSNDPPDEAVVTVSLDVSTTSWSLVVHRATSDPRWASRFECDLAVSADPEMGGVLTSGDGARVDSVSFELAAIGWEDRDGFELVCEAPAEVDWALSLSLEIRDPEQIATCPDENDAINYGLCIDESVRATLDPTSAVAAFMLLTDGIPVSTLNA